MEEVIQNLVKYAPIQRFRGCKSCDLTAEALSDSEEMMLRQAAGIARRKGEYSLEKTLMSLIRR